MFDGWVKILAYPHGSLKSLLFFCENYFSTPEEWHWCLECFFPNEIRNAYGEKAAHIVTETEPPSSMLQPSQTLVCQLFLCVVYQIFSL